jgi:hypothetical protein
MLRLIALAAPVHRHRAAERRQPVGERPPQAAPGPGHQSDLPLQHALARLIRSSCHHFSSSDHRVDALCVGSMRRRADQVTPEPVNRAPRLARRPTRSRHVSNARRAQGTGKGSGHNHLTISNADPSRLTALLVGSIWFNRVTIE